MTNILQERRKDAEMKLMEMSRANASDKTNIVNAVKIKLIKIFFNIFDAVESSRHSEIIERLYFSDESSLAKLEDIANEVFVDISTLRRYRQKYIKAILYIIEPPCGSCLYKVLEKVRTESDRANSARPFCWDI